MDFDHIHLDSRRGCRVLQVKSNDAPSTKRLPRFATCQNWLTWRLYGVEVKQDGTLNERVDLTCTPTSS